MKKYLFICITLATTLFIVANPLIPPSVAISELAFDADGKWVMELQCFDGGPYMPIDSIIIYCKSGNAKLEKVNFQTPYIILVNEDSLNTELNINPDGDSISLEYYYMGYTRYNGFNSMIYGNYAGSKVRKSKVGESIAGVPFNFSYNGNYCIDKSPSIGVENDSTGMCCTLKGNIFDLNNELLKLTNGRFDYFLTSEEFKTKQDGSYTAKLFAMNYNITSMFYYTSFNQGKWVKIEPLTIQGEPDSVINADIHLQSSIYSSIPEVDAGTESLFKVFPNPVHDLSFNYEVTLPVLSSKSYIEIINFSGQKMANYPLAESSGKISLPNSLPHGTYLVRLLVNEKNYASSKITVTD